jgi:hypothetical protein
MLTDVPDADGIRASKIGTLDSQVSPSLNYHSGLRDTVRGEKSRDCLRQWDARNANIQLLEAGLRKIEAAIGPEQKRPLRV